MPTLDESGIKGYEVTTWYALMAPRGTPAAVLQRLGAELSRVLKQPDVSKRFEEQGVTAGDMTPAQLAGFIRKETERWTRVAKTAGAVAD